MARVRLASCRVLLRLMLASRAPPQTLSDQDAARRLSPMRAWCSHCRAGVDDKRLQHVREHGALIGGCNVLPSSSIRNTCSPRARRLASPRRPCPRWHGYHAFFLLAQRCSQAFSPPAQLRVTRCPLP
jgi:hypothetical protein